MWTQVRDALDQSFSAMVEGMVRLLPGAIALLMSLLIAGLLGWLFGMLLRRALTGVDFDRRMAAWGSADMGGWAGGRSPTLLAARLVTWLIVFAGFVVGTAAFDPTLTSQLAYRLFGSAMNLLTAVVLLIAGGIVARFVSQSILITLVNLNVREARLLSLGVKWLVQIMAGAMALNHLSIGGRIVELAFGILFGGIVLALALAVGLRSKDFADWTMARQSEETPKGDARPFDHL
jgi:carbon starvation protein CstA